MSSFKSLSDLVLVNDSNLSDVEDISDLVQDAPFLAALAAGTASNGTTHKYIKEITAPTVGFRAVNVGRAHSKSGDQFVTADLKILDASFTVDKNLADEYKRGAESFLSMEASRHLRQAFFIAEQQLFYGTGGGDAGGFVGLADALDEASDANVTALSGTATAPTSVWFVRSMGDERDAMLILGNEGNLKIDPSFVQRVEDESTANTYYPAYVTPISGWMGLQLGSIWSLHRLANVETATTGDKLTDDRIYSALKRFPANRKPNMIVMNQDALEDLRTSRTATNATGAPAPIPEFVAGVPIVVSDAITSSETIVT